MFKKILQIRKIKILTPFQKSLTYIVASGNIKKVRSY